MWWKGLRSDLSNVRKGKEVFLLKSPKQKQNPIYGSTDDRYGYLFFSHIKHGSG